jgi:hypothetical protein
MRLMIEHQAPFFLDWTKGPSQVLMYSEGAILSIRLAINSIIHPLKLNV